MATTYAISRTPNCLGPNHQNHMDPFSYQKSTLKTQRQDVSYRAHKRQKKQPISAGFIDGLQGAVNGAAGVMANTVLPGSGPIVAKSLEAIENAAAQAVGVSSNGASEEAAVNGAGNSVIAENEDRTKEQPKSSSNGVSPTKKASLPTIVDGAEKVFSEQDSIQQAYQKALIIRSLLANVDMSLLAKVAKLPVPALHPELKAWSGSNLEADMERMDALESKIRAFQADNEKGA